MEPAKPALIYLEHPQVAVSLAENFETRGPTFRNFVIDYVTATPIAQSRGWRGHAGVQTFWGEFVTLTSTIFHVYSMDKLALDVSQGAWKTYQRQVAQFLSLPLVLEPSIGAATAAAYVGTYAISGTKRRCAIQYAHGHLYTDLFMGVSTRLIMQNRRRFLVEKWHFELAFTLRERTGEAISFTVRGHDVDYLKAVGQTARKVTSA